MLSAAAISWPKFGSVSVIYIEEKSLSPDTCQTGHSTECGLCGEQVQLD